jgi:type II secretory pathway component PulC
VSIIYDALQKTQRHRSVNRDGSQRQVSLKMKIIDKGLMLAIVLLSAVVLYAYHPFILKLFHRSAKVPLVAVVPAAPALVYAAPPPNLVLNGVLMSDENQTALINNQFFHLGDVVNGMKIVSIELNNVRLQRENEIVVLRTAG